MIQTKGLRALSVMHDSGDIRMEKGEERKEEEEVSYLNFFN